MSRARKQVVNRMALSPQEAAEALGIGLWTVQRLLREGRLPYRRAGKRILIPITALEAFLNGEEVRNAAS